jgi:dTDP-4-dehydrorhamnose 3,5-epimerase
MDRLIGGVLLTPLKIIAGDNGNIYHLLRSDAPGYISFGEAYISTVKKNARKGWKCHTKMVLNIVVPIGEIKFILFDGRSNSATKGTVNEITLSINNYKRLTVPAGIWMAFEGIDEENFLINLASIPHDPSEAQTLDIQSAQVPYEWK